MAFGKVHILKIDDVPQPTSKTLEMFEYFLITSRNFFSDNVPVLLQIVIYQNLYITIQVPHFASILPFFTIDKA